MKVYLEKDDVVESYIDDNNGAWMMKIDASGSKWKSIWRKIVIMKIYYNKKVKR